MVAEVRLGPLRCAASLARIGPDELALLPRRRFKRAPFATYPIQQSADVMPQDTDIDWLAVRADYEARSKKVTDILQEYGIISDDLYARIECEDWRRRTKTHAPTRHTLILKLFRILERKIEQVETTMDQPLDKEVAILGNLTRNLEKLIELDDVEKSRRGHRTKRADIDAMREKLVRRIEQLKQQ